MTFAGKTPEQTFHLKRASDNSEIVLEKKLKFGRDTIKRMQRNIFELCLIIENIISKYLLG